MITIEHLEVLFETERERDEARFGELFAAHLARHEAARRYQKATEEQAEADRSLDGGGSW
jgi:hypothetical protein